MSLFGGGISQEKPGGRDAKRRRCKATGGGNGPTQGWPRGHGGQRGQLVCGQGAGSGAVP